MATISINNLAEAIYESSVGKTGALLDSVSKNATDFMVRHNMMGKAQQILEKLEDIVNRSEGIVIARVTAKEKLRDEQIEDIKKMIAKKYKAKNVTITEVKDSNILGGIKIEIGDEIIDMTLRNGLNKLESYLMKSQ